MRSTLLISLFALLAACQGTPTLQSGPNAQISYGGLTRVDNTRLDTAWVRAGIDLSDYDSLMLVGAGIKFRSVRDVNRIYLSNFQGIALDDEQKDYIQRTAREVFTEAIARTDQFEIVDEPGPNTLTLTGSLIDVVSYVPPEDDSVDTIYFYLSELGEATLVLELADSESGQVLARATDRQTLEPLNPNIESDIITNRFELEAELNRWGNQIRSSLEYLATTPILPAE